MYFTEKPDQKLNKSYTGQKPGPKSSKQTANQKPTKSDIEVKTPAPFKPLEKSTSNEKKMKSDAKDATSQNDEFDEVIEDEEFLDEDVTDLEEEVIYFICPVNGNRLAPYYMEPKHTGELWVYIGTPLPNPSGNTGVMLCMYVCNLFCISN